MELPAYLQATKAIGLANHGIRLKPDTECKWCTNTKVEGDDVCKPHWYAKRFNFTTWQEVYGDNQN